MGDSLRRREFITLLGGAAAGRPLLARAQQPPMPVIGILGSTSLEAVRDQIAAFQRGLGEAGYVEGQNVAIEYRWAEGRYDRLPVLATELIQRRVSVIVPIAPPAALAAKAATATLPVVFAIGADPVDLGLVTSLSRPTGNVTGVTFFTTGIETKRLELLHELVPNAKKIAVLVNPNFAPAVAASKELDGVGPSRGLQVHVVKAGNEHEFDIAFVDLIEWGANALLVLSDAFFYSRRDQLVALAARHRVPAIYQLRGFAEAGGLMSYGASLSENGRQTGIYAGRVLKGAKPADLPVLQPTKFDLVINLKTAKALGLDVPPQLQQLADEVIE
jgi:putative tryptophan/tyrosine transport system substrate-binding protein